MARKPPVYAAVELEPVASPAPAPQPEPEKPTVAQAKAPAGKRGRPPAVRSMRDAASPVMLYLHPAGHKALKRYALEQDGKVHDLLIQAVEEWSKRKGLREPMRVEAGQE